MSAKKSNVEFSNEETARRRDDAIRRAMNMRPKPFKDIVGKSERAKAQRKCRVTKAAQLKPKTS
jgi:hypothetical protein